jgi:hypothetical protein
LIFLCPGINAFRWLQAIYDTITEWIRRGYTIRSFPYIIDRWIETSNDWNEASRPASKKTLNKFKKYFGLLVPLLTTSLLFLSYMFTLFVVSLYNSNNLQSISEEFSKTAKAETFYIYWNNVLYSTMFDPEMPVNRTKLHLITWIFQ